MTSNEFHVEKAPAPVGAYPHARRFGEMLFLSGVGPRKPGTTKIPGTTLDGEGKVVAHDVEAQTMSVIENIQVILEESGSSLDKIIDITVFLTDMQGDFQKFNKLYAEKLGHIGCTRTTVEVGALPTPICVEFKVIASI